MKVSLRTYGGQAATFKRPPHIVDSEDLGQESQNELRRLVDTAIQASAGPGSTSLEAGPARDAMSYAITIEVEGGSEVVLEAADGNVPKEFAELRDFVRTHRQP